MHHYYRKVFISCLLVLIVYAACRKADHPASSAEYIDPAIRFFNGSQPANDLVQAIRAFALRENEQKQFVPTLVQQIGYPQWGNAITIAAASPAKSGRTGADSVQITYIPFVRDSQQHVNATLAVATSPGDTSLRIFCDWQYSDTAATGLSKAQFALTMMALDKAVFGNRLYRLTDSTIFSPRARYIRLGGNGGANRSSGTPAASLLEWVYTYTLCWTAYVPLHEGQVVGCLPGENCQLYTEEEQCIEISWSSGGGAGGGSTGPIGGTGGGGGTGSGGGWIPPNNPNPCGSGVALRTQVQEGCGVGWVPAGGGGGVTPPPNDSTIAENLKRLIQKAIKPDKNIPDSLHNKAQQDGLERCFTFLKIGGDTVVSWIRTGTSHNSSPTLDSKSFAIFHTHQEDDPVGGSDRNQCFDGPDIYKLYKNSCLDGFPIAVSIITTRDYYYAAVITDVTTFKTYIQSLCGTIRIDLIERALFNKHINAMDSCTSALCNWQKKTELGALVITGVNNSQISGIKIYRSPRNNINFTLLTP